MDITKATSTDEILAAMRMGVDYTFDIRLRGFSVPVRPISVAETLQVASEVSRDMATIPSQSRTNVHEAYLIALYTLQRASRPFDSRVESALTKGTIDRFTSAELLGLFEQYRDGCNRLDPALEEISHERLRELVEAAKKNTSTLTGLSRKHLETLALYLLTSADSPEGKSSGS